MAFGSKTKNPLRRFSKTHRRDNGYEGHVGAHHRFFFCCGSMLFKDGDTGGIRAYVIPVGCPPVQLRRLLAAHRFHVDTRVGWPSAVSL